MGSDGYVLIPPLRPPELKYNIQIRYGFSFVVYIAWPPTVLNYEYSRLHLLIQLRVLTFLYLEIASSLVAKCVPPPRHSSEIAEHRS